MATYGTFVNGVSLKAAEVNDFFKWTTFTGVVKQPGTLGTSSNICRYARVNDLVIATFNFKVLGAGTASNRIEVNLPITASTTSSRSIGFGTIRDDSTSTFYRVVPVLNATGTMAFISSFATSLTTYVGMTNGPALTLASNDDIQATIVYEAA
jgi:hypothetical protein